MKVVLRTDVDNVGKKGDICDVADGFGRNYLIPRGQALKATAGVVAQAAAMRRSREVRNAKDREDAQAQGNRLSGVTVQITAKAGDDGKLFGSISSSDVARAIKDQAGIEVDRRKIDLEHGIKATGQYRVPVKLHSDVEIELPIEVVGE